MLVGRNASNDHSTMIARTDDGHFDVKKVIVIDPKKQPRKYKSVIGQAEIDLPDDPMRCTMCPSVDPKHGIWAATGINAEGVGMTATETITSNPRVLVADPMVVPPFSPFGPAPAPSKKGKKEKPVPGGIGEEDIVVLVLPYIHSAREGVERLASLLEQYGTYESNGIAFNDENEVWWLETIGGHHWMAKRVPDDVCVVNPNQFGMDSFDLDDAFGEKKAHLCSKDLREFIKDNDLDCNQNGVFNPRNVFGSHSDMDHIYNTPRAWFMGRYLTPFSHKWDGPDAEFTPESDNIPWSFVPDRKVAVEDVKYLLSSNYQGTPYNPYLSRDTGMRGMYRSIGINRTGVTSICQIRSDMPKELRGLEWIMFGSTTFAAALPLYTGVTKMPKYVSDVTTDTSTENFYWSSRLIGALVDPYYSASIQNIERYHNAMFVKGRQIVKEYDEKILKSGDFGLMEEANEKLCEMAKTQTTQTLNRVLLTASEKMKNGYNRADN